VFRKQKWWCDFCSLIETEEKKQEMQQIEYLFQIELEG